MDIVEYVKTFPLKTFAKGEVLLQPGTELSSILIIREGTVKVTSINESGAERLLWIAGRYDIVPTEGILSRSIQPQYFYTAFCDGSAYVVDRKDFLTQAAENPEIMTQVARGLSDHYDDLLSRLNSIEQLSLRHKILFMLQAVCNKFSGADTVELHDVGLNLTHQDIADMVHATREAVSIGLKTLQDEGLIDYSRATFTVYKRRIDQEIETPA